MRARGGFLCFAVCSQQGSAGMEERRRRDRTGVGRRSWRGRGAGAGLQHRLGRRGEAAGEGRGGGQGAEASGANRGGGFCFFFFARLRESDGCAGSRS